MTENKPSRFWRSLGADHADALEQHGFGQVKRRQVSRYFMWQWRWRQVQSSEQFRFLVRRTRPSDWISVSSTSSQIGRAHV